MANIKLLLGIITTYMDRIWLIISNISRFIYKLNYCAIAIAVAVAVAVAVAKTRPTQNNKIQSISDDFYLKLQHLQWKLYYCY